MLSLLLGGQDSVSHQSTQQWHNGRANEVFMANTMKGTFDLSVLESA